MNDAVFYNDNDSFVCAWLRELIADRLLPAGVVDERSITDVRPEDCRPTSHFFAGIGGWPCALELAGWEGPVWTASCPCQPLSCARKRAGHADERHLWPALYALIAQCRPPVVFGEQVASTDGREWLAGVRADLEAAGYAVGAADLCAAGVGAPHIRQRLYWCAVRLGDSGSERRQQIAGSTSSYEAADGRQSHRNHIASGAGADGGLAISDQRRRGSGESDAASSTTALHTDIANGTAHGLAESAGARHDGAGQHGSGPSPLPARPEQCGEAGGMADTENAKRGSTGAAQYQGRRTPQTGRPSADGGLGNAAGAGMERQRGDGNGSGQPGRQSAQQATGYMDAAGYWADSRPIYCRDGRWRRIPLEPAFQPLASGVSSGRVGILRGAGNSIVAPLAAQFIKAVIEVLG